MPRSQVKVSYQRIQRKSRPRGRRKPQEAMVYTIRPRSPLARYLFENADSGLSVHELVGQFQEYDCEHGWGEEPVAVTDLVKIFQCSECGLTKHKKIPGKAS